MFHEDDLTKEDIKSVLREFIKSPDGEKAIKPVKDNIGHFYLRHEFLDVFIDSDFSVQERCDEKLLSVLRKFKTASDKRDCSFRSEVVSYIRELASENLNQTSCSSLGYRA